ncbi:hypothetical protein [Tenacibaculum amylolyticum]|uniref:hypothetical protein n=1 Tax=Tenacibaculum amylolyticum TaxID=104269 RepID=UPI00389584B6
MFQKILIILVFITLSSCSKQYNKNLLEITSDNNKIILNDNDFKITKNLNRLEIKIIDTSKLDSIKKLKDCSMLLYYKHKYIIEGNFYKSSKKPKKKCDYFFPEDKDQRIKIWDDDLIILLPIK